MTPTPIVPPAGGVFRSNQMALPELATMRYSVWLASIPTNGVGSRPVAEPYACALPNGMSARSWKPRHTLPRWERRHIYNRVCKNISPQRSRELCIAIGRNCVMFG